MEINVFLLISVKGRSGTGVKSHFREAWVKPAPTPSQPCLMIALEMASNWKTPLNKRSCDCPQRALDHETATNRCLLWIWKSDHWRLSLMTNTSHDTATTIDSQASNHKPHNCKSTTVIFNKFVLGFEQTIDDKLFRMSKNCAWYKVS